MLFLEVAFAGNGKSIRAHETSKFVQALFGIVRFTNEGSKGPGDLKGGKDVRG